MNITYLTWGETPRSYGVFNSQVISQFVANKKIMNEDNFTFISAIPIIHSGMIREKFNYKNELNKVRNNLNGIRFIRIPIYAPQNFVNSSELTFFFMHFGAHRELAQILRSQQTQIIHCRGYHATYAALITREKHNLNYKVIFDARGLWPEEIALKKKYKDNNSNYIFLKKIEQKLLQNSDITITVSDTMKEHYQKTTDTRIENIYLSTIVKNLPKKANNHQEEKVLIYVGALSDNTWHKPKPLADLYAKFRTIWPKSRLIIVTTSNHQPLKNHFQAIPKEEVTYTSIRNNDELYNKLSEANFACLPYFIPRTKKEKMISKTVLAVKTVEYLSAGLPIISNKYCGGAFEIIKKYNLGVNYNPSSLEEITKEKLESLLDKNISTRAKTVAEKYFSYTNNALRYKNIYRDLSK